MFVFVYDGKRQSSKVVKHLAKQSDTVCQSAAKSYIYLLVYVYTQNTTDDV